MKRPAVVRKWLISFIALSAIGCSKADSGRIPVYPTNGKVIVNGLPAEGAQVVLYGAAPDLTGPGTVPPVGVTDAAGGFRLRSWEPDDGAPAGKFNVTVTWPEPIPAGANSEMYQPKDRLKGRYADPKKSGLVVEVPEGGGELPPFNL